VFHEVAHGLVANMLGDPTAAERGRLSFNPIRHVDPIGTVALPLVLAVTGAPMFGWAKPVPVVAQRLRNPRIDMMLVALAGPAMNLLLATLATIALGVLIAAAGPESEGIAGFAAANLLNFLVINVSLAIFNMLPIPPFDGGHIVEGLLPRPLAARYAALGRYGFLVLVVLIVILPQLSPRLDVLSRIVWPIVEAVTRLFLGSIGIGG
jgi:Zn-dependent protease